jgi:hypothetical protein
MTKCIAKSVKKKNTLYKKYLCHPTTNNEDKYKRYKNRKKEILRGTINKLQTLNEIMNRHKNDMLPREFNGNGPGEIISDPYTIANKFNNYFVNVGPGITRNIPNSKRTFNEYLPNSYKNNFFLEAITKSEVETEIKNSNSKKSSGYDGISLQIIQNISSLRSSRFIYFLFEDIFI